MTPQTTNIFSILLANPLGVGLALALLAVI
jgi:hypothetical protein